MSAACVAKLNALVATSATTKRRIFSSFERTRSRRALNNRLQKTVIRPVAFEWRVWAYEGATQSVKMRIGQNGPAIPRDVANKA
jgi:hypothetical protein